MRKNCPICNKWNEPTVKKVKKRNGRESLNFELSIATCKVCKFMYQSPEINEKIINDIYEKDYVGGRRKQAKRFSRNKIFRRRSALSFERYIKNNGDFSVLEIGCSSGYNLMNISEKYRNIITEGVDLDKESIEFGKRKGLNISNNNAFQSTAKYDVVFLNHVFEHIVDMDDFLINLKAKVKPNGIIVLNVPNSYKWKETGSWEHVNYFSEKSMTKLLKKNRMTNFELSTHCIDKKRHYVPEIRTIIHIGGSEIITTEPHDLWKPKDDIYINRTRARDNYDAATSKEERAKQVRIYKKNKKGRNFKQLLLWSRLYILFSGKWR